jgi:hypothetical protein
MFQTPWIKGLGTALFSGCFQREATGRKPQKRTWEAFSLTPRLVNSNIFLDEEEDTKYSRTGVLLWFFCHFGT